MADYTSDEHSFIFLMQDRGWNHIERSANAKREEFLLKNASGVKKWNGGESEEFFIVRRDSALVFTKHDSVNGNRTVIFSATSGQGYMYNGPLMNISGGTLNAVVTVHSETYFYTHADDVLGKIMPGVVSRSHVYRPPTKSVQDSVWAAVQGYGNGS